MASFLMSFCQWAEATGLSTVIKNSKWLFPFIEAIHLLALALLGGTVLAVDFRVFGLLWKRQSIARLADDLRPWMLGSLVTMLITGILLFMSEATKCYANVPFRFKMIFLLAAMLFTLTVRRKKLDSVPVENSVGSLSLRLICLTSLALWSGVGFMGRAIGFY